MRTFAIVTLGISVPLAVAYVGFDGKLAAAIFSGVSVVALLCLLSTFDSIKEAAGRTGQFLRRPLQQAFLASSSAAACGVGALLTWSSNETLRFILMGLAVIAVNWWLHLLMRTAAGQVLVRKDVQSREDRRKLADLETANELLHSQLADLKSDSARVGETGDQNTRMRTVIHHVMNVLLGLEGAIQGKSGVKELGIEAWVEHRCLVATRDIFEEMTCRPDDYRIELGVIRISNGVVRVEMAAGDFLGKLRDKGGCPEFGDVAATVARKVRQGGFDDSFTAEFSLSDEPHHLVALVKGDLDETDRQLLSLVATMFLVLQVAFRDSDADAALG